MTFVPGRVLLVWGCTGVLCIPVLAVLLLSQRDIRVGPQTHHVCSEAHTDVMLGHSGCIPIDSGTASTGIHGTPVHPHTGKTRPCTVTDVITRYERGLSVMCVFTISPIRHIVHHMFIIIITVCDRCVSWMASISPIGCVCYWCVTCLSCVYQIAYHVYYYRWYYGVLAVCVCVLKQSFTLCQH